MPVTFPIRDEAKKEIDSLIWDKFTKQEIEKKLSTTEGIEIFFDLFLHLRAPDPEQYALYYRVFLEKINSEFDKIVDSDEKKAAALKVMIVFKKMGDYTFKDFKEKHEIFKFEREIKNKLDILEKNKKLETEKLIQLKFNELKLHEPVFNEKPFSDFPKKEAWRFYLDGRYQKINQEFGWGASELREPGWLNELHNAFTYALDTIEQDLSVELLGEIHQKAVLKVKEIGYQKGKIRGNDNVRYQMPDFSLLGLSELHEESKNNLKYYVTDANYEFYDGNCYLSEDPKKYRTMMVNYEPFSESTVKEIMSEIIKRYYIEFKEAKNDRFLQFQAIVKLSSDLVRFHPYNDGNTRVLVNIVLKRELIKYGFKPVILENPNWFDNLSKEELCLETLKGIENFEYVKKNGIYPEADPTFTTDNFIEYIEGEAKKAENIKLNTIIPKNEGFVETIERLRLEEKNKEIIKRGNVTTEPIKSPFNHKPIVFKTEPQKDRPKFY